MSSGRRCTTAEDDVRCDNMDRRVRASMRQTAQLLTQLQQANELASPATDSLNHSHASNRRRVPSRATCVDDSAEIAPIVSTKKPPRHSTSGVSKRLPHLQMQSQPDRDGAQSVPWLAGSKLSDVGVTAGARFSPPVAAAATAAPPTPTSTVTGAATTDDSAAPTPGATSSRRVDRERSAEAAGTAIPPRASSPLLRGYGPLAGASCVESVSHGGVGGEGTAGRTSRLVVPSTDKSHKSPCHNWFWFWVRMAFSAAAFLLLWATVAKLEQQKFGEPIWEDPPLS
eukprot:GHVU01085107.1.p1 GENE.GHVU01085107.1~~GHVU01085107.1.p1  ORF type:complete len:284 (+),score=26.39 GHVU01085107.1:174-1025(+)